MPQEIFDKKSFLGVRKAAPYEIPPVIKDTYQHYSEKPFSNATATHG